MTDFKTVPLDQVQVILFDYSALFEVGQTSAFKYFMDKIVINRISVVLCASFNYYHACVHRTQNDNEIAFLHQIEAFLDLLSTEKLLTYDSSVITMISLLPKYTLRKEVCLFSSANSAVVNQIRASCLVSDMCICLFEKDNFSFYPDTASFLLSKELCTVNPISVSSDYLDVEIYVNIGDKVYSEQGVGVVLSEKISTGSEGLVFRTEDPNMVAKIYHRGVMTALRWMKLTRMTRMNLHAKGICWPSTLLYNQSHEPVGYLMPVGHGYTLGSVFDGQDAILEHFPDWDRRSVVQAACQIFEKIIYLHLHGILIGDIQLKNFMINSPKEVYLIDMDSVQLQDLPCPVGTEEFTPPELWDRSFSSFLRTSLHEDYSCGILAFSLLFCGQHPYNQRLGKETLRDEIIAYSFPYTCGGKDDIGIPVGGYDKIWQAIPVRLQEMFCNAFSHGTRYETVEWYAALDSYIDMLNSKSFADPEDYSLFPYTKKEEAALPETSPGIKRSIRDSIIHVPESSGDSHTYSDYVMYDGKAVSSAFINQEKLTELDIEKHSDKQVKREPDSIPENQTLKANKTALESKQKNPESVQKVLFSKDAYIKAAKKNLRLPYLVPILILAIIVMVVILYVYYFTQNGNMNP